MNCLTIKAVLWLGAHNAVQRLNAHNIINGRGLKFFISHDIKIRSAEENTMIHQKLRFHHYRQVLQMTHLLKSHYFKIGHVWENTMTHYNGMSLSLKGCCECLKHAQHPRAGNKLC